MSKHPQLRRAEDTDPDPSPAADTQFTPQQEREMGIRDDKDRTIQPTNAALMIGLMYLGVAAVALVAVILFYKLMRW